MGVFVSLIPDSNIIKSAEDFSSVAIVGCSGCAIFSIAYEKDQPLPQITSDETTGKPKRLPYALLEQTRHLKKLLEDKEVNVITEILMGPCRATDDGELKELYGNPDWADPGFNERCAEAEAFITLCCSGGVFGLKQRLGKDIRIVPGMRNAGTWQSFLTLDEEKKFILIDKDRSTVIQRKSNIDG